MSLRVVEPCVSPGGTLAKSRVVKCFNCHICPPSGSADFFSESTKRRVRIGVMLESEYERQPHPDAIQGNLHSVCISYRELR